MVKTHPVALVVSSALWFAAWLGSGGPLLGADEPAFRRIEDVVYGRKFGTALTLDVFQPKTGGNGLGVIAIVSGGWISSHDSINPDRMKFWTDRGYTVFAVVHGCQPKFTIPEIVNDMNRAVRFIRYHAGDYAIDPDHLGVYGSSAGGHLSLMLGTAGDAGNSLAKDPVDRVSSRVQAVACFFPPTDFLNYGQTGETAIGVGILKDYAAPFDFQTIEPKRRTYEPITDRAKIEEIARAISPINHATPDDPPTLIIHGDADKLVPIQQAEIMVAKLKEAGVEAKLIPKPGAAHGWPQIDQDLKTFADWFDNHLKPKTSSKFT